MRRGEIEGHELWELMLNGFFSWRVVIAGSAAGVGGHGGVGGAGGYVNGNSNERDSSVYVLHASLATYIGI